MDTQKKAKKPVPIGRWAVSRFIILIPHRDTLKPLGEYRQRLFAGGFPGAYSFPAAAPLAVVSRPFDREELKQLAGNIRTLTKENDCKIRSEETSLCLPCRPFMSPAPQSPQSDRLSFFGPMLNLAISDKVFPLTAKVKILHIFSPPVLCAALVDSINAEKPSRKDIHPAPLISFSAAALANLVIRPLDARELLPDDGELCPDDGKPLSENGKRLPDGEPLPDGELDYSYEWKIGPPVWLPARKKG